jgi:peroxiredoxin
MVRPGFRAAAAGLPLALAVLAGCGDAKEKGRGPVKTYTYDYGSGGEVNMAELAAQFHDAAPANRKADDLPLAFTDAQGKPVDLGQFRGKANVVLTVVKGMPQSPGGLFCPGCLAQVNSFSANVDGFKKRDAEVLVVFPGPADNLNDFLVQAKAIPAKETAAASAVPLLLDKDMAACRRLDILGDWAKPSTYVIDKKGKVVYAYVGEGTTDRPSLKALFAELDKLNAK